MTSSGKKLLREYALVTLTALAFAAFFSHELLGRLFIPGAAFDWDFFLELHWVPYYEVLHFHQFPLWNPYKCGGMPMLGNPQSGFLTPFFLLQLLVGPVAGLHLEIPLHIAVAWVGGYFLARTLGLGWLAAITLGSAFPASSWLYLHLSEGHVVFLPAAYFPWVMACAWRSARTDRLTPAMVAGALCALILGEGGIYSLSQAGVMVGVMLLAMALVERRLIPLLSLLAIGLFTTGFASIKLLPAAHTMLGHPRPWESYDVNHIRTLLTALFSRNQDNYRPWAAPWGFHEYGAYVSVFPFLALASVAAWRQRGVKIWWFVALIVFLLMLGDFVPYSPWSLLHRLPIYSSERVPSRFAMPFTLAIAALAAYGVEWLARWRAGRLLSACLIVVGIVDAWVVASPDLAHIFDAQDPPIKASPIFRQYQASTYSMFPIGRANLGAVSCYEYTWFTTQALGFNQQNYRGEQYLLGPGQVRLLRWSPNVLSYQVNALGHAILVINQNYDGGWRLWQGQGRLRSLQGLLAIEMTRGRHTIVLRYLGSDFLLGSAITLLTVVLAWALWRVEDPALPVREHGPSEPLDNANALLADLRAVFAYCGTLVDRAVAWSSPLRSRYPRGWEILSVGAGSLLFAAFYCHPLWGRLNQVSLTLDWDRFLEQHWAIYQALAKYHQFPFWTPYKCGGMPLLGNPESTFLTPFIVLDLLFGPVAGAYLAIPLHLAIAMAGAYVLARVYGLGVWGGTSAALAYAGSSWFALHLAAGHVVFLPFAYLPWVLAVLWFACAQERPAGAIAGALLLALMLGEGGVHPLTFTVVTAGLMTSAAVLTMRSVKPLGFFCLMLLFACLFAAPKLLPAIDLMVRHPRPPIGSEVYSPYLLLSAMFSRNQDLYRPAPGWGFHEYGAYVGLPALILFIVGVVGAWRRSVAWLAITIVLFSLAMGAFGRWAPWVLIHYLPALSSEMVAPRFLIPLTLALGMVVGCGAQRLVSGSARGLLPLLLIVMTVDDCHVSSVNFFHIFDRSAPAPAAAIGAQFRQALAPSSQLMLPFNWANLGVANCYEYTVFPSHVTAYNQVGYDGEYQLTGRGGSLRLLRWSPDALTFVVNPTGSERLLINQNYYPGWRLARGRGEIVEVGGLLGVQLQPGGQTVELVYRSPGFYLGLLIELVGMVTAVGLLLEWPRARARQDLDSE
ncbi:MAG TPA: hypothetical protein VKV28_08640 [Candidatus Binataceae bacterium]|nr:hypothetical protein [Candidatus Binataceae bacterium]